MVVVVTARNTKDEPYGSSMSMVIPRTLLYNICFKPTILFFPVYISVVVLVESESLFIVSVCLLVAKARANGCQNDSVECSFIHNYIAAAPKEGINRND